MHTKLNKKAQNIICKQSPKPNFQTSFSPYIYNGKTSCLNRLSLNLFKKFANLIAAEQLFLRKLFSLYLC